MSELKGSPVRDVELLNEIFRNHLEAQQRALMKAFEIHVSSPEDLDRRFVMDGPKKDPGPPPLNGNPCCEIPIGDSGLCMIGMSTADHAKAQAGEAIKDTHYRQCEYAMKPNGEIVNVGIERSDAFYENQDLVRCDGQSLPADSVWDNLRQAWNGRAPNLGIHSKAVDGQPLIMPTFSVEEVEEAALELLRNEWNGAFKPAPVKRCECGKEKHGFAAHSSWCDLASENQK